MPAGSTDKPGSVVLRAEDVKVFFTKNGILEKPTVIKAVDGVTLEIGRGEVLALVGESGSGKTTLGRAILGLIRPTDGSITFFDGDSRDVGGAKGRAWKSLRRHLQMIFQDPFSSIDPNMRVYDVLRIPLAAQGVRGRPLVQAKVREVIDRVGLPEQILESYVFQLSGGQRQRIGIARVLLFDPSLVVADEPVSMLDASLKGDILHIIETESEKRSVAFVFITHDMAVAKIVADRIAVMYLGKVDEIGPAQSVVTNALHPYTKAILQASPVVDPSLRNDVRKMNIVGEPPSSTAHPPGCKFHPRCPYAMEICRREEPVLKESEPGHLVACWLY